MLDRYGWSEALQQQFTPHAANGLEPARVTVQQRGLYTIVTERGELSAALAGKLAHFADEGGYPVTGDWVAVSARHAEGSATIRHVLPRGSSFTRRAAGPGAARGQVVAANVDTVLLTASLNADFSLRRIERYLATAWESGAAPVIVLTKADLCDDVESFVMKVEAIAFGVPVHAISAVTGEGVEAVRAHLGVGKTAVLLGSSGVGKSTLVNALAGEALMTTRELRDDETGQHTTTHRELLVLASGALVIDTPGMRELGLWDAGDGVTATFGDLEALAAQCRFHDCRHRREPGCAVRAAIADGSLDESRLDSWNKLQREMAFEARKDDVRLRAETRKMHIQRQMNYRAMKRFKERDE